MTLGLVLLSVIAFASPAFAQRPVEGYVSGGVGSWSNNFNSGALFGGAGGVEGRVAPHVGIGGEVGTFTTIRGDLLLSVGVDGRAHFGSPQASGQWSPYVLAGYSRLTSFEQSDNALQFGVGADYRTGPHRGVRLELRDLVRQSGVTSHYWTVRLGLTFR